MSHTDTEKKQVFRNFRFLPFLLFFVEFSIDFVESFFNIVKQWKNSLFKKISLGDDKNNLYKKMHQIDTEVVDKSKFFCCF